MSLPTRTCLSDKLRSLAAKKGIEPVSALTAYDYAVARILDEAGIDIILVGDSLGMMVFGHQDTTQVTVDMMVHHVKACRDATKRSLLVADLPYQSYQDDKQSLETARELVKAGAEAVKLEGGKAVTPQIKTILSAKIPVFGHIGMLPQQVKQEGGYKKKGKTDIEAAALIEDARQLDKAGVSAIILENIVSPLAKQITRTTNVPTIGIGSGKDCDGQILVINDLLGSYPWFCPPFAKPKADFASETTQAVKQFVAELANPSRS
jgi:3-methyl-2-oxobutanoate hydroxymethyltransferase